MFWTCPSCILVNLPSSRSCDGCGSTQPALLLRHNSALFAKPRFGVSGGYLKVRERYVRPDLPIPSFSAHALWLAPTASTLDAYLDILDSPHLPCVVILSSVLSRLQALGYARTLEHLSKAIERNGWTVLLDEFLSCIPRKSQVGETFQALTWLGVHLESPPSKASLCVLSENAELRLSLSEARIDNIEALSFADFCQRKAASLLPPDAVTAAQAQCEGGRGGFEGYWTAVELERQQDSLVRGKLNVRGDEALVGTISVPREGFNHAMHGDTVLVHVGSKRVVAVVERGWRQLVATLAIEDAERLQAESSSSKWLVVVPMDRRLPRMRMQTRLGSILVDKRIVVRPFEWPPDAALPSCAYVATLGPALELTTESAALLVETGLADHAKPFTRAVLECLPPADFEPGLDDARTDLSHLDVVSIDPVGCMDIDDALSLETKPDGTRELGVHIADVAYYVRAGSELDKEAARRATSVYLQERRLDMLPLRLCEDLASLRPRVPRLAVSLLVPLTPEGVVPSQCRVVRSVIRSRHALAYEQAQRLCDGAEPGEEPGKGWTGKSVPSEDVGWLRAAIRGLTDLARGLKKKREVNAAAALALTHPVQNRQAGQAAD